MREDNTIERLGSVANAFGLIDATDRGVLERLVSQRTQLREAIEGLKLVPNSANLAHLNELNTPAISKPITGSDLLRREEITCGDLRRFGLDVPEDQDVVEPVEIHVKYAGYIKRQSEMIAQARRLEDLHLPSDLVYHQVRGLSIEEVEKLDHVRPTSLGQAQRISGVNPSAVQALMVHLKGRERRGTP